jgi:hypothetical protein
MKYLYRASLKLSSSLLVPCSDLNPVAAALNSGHKHWLLGAHTINPSLKICIYNEGKTKPYISQVCPIHTPVFIQSSQVSCASTLLGVAVSVGLRSWLVEEKTGCDCNWCVLSQARQSGIKYYRM